MSFHAARLPTRVDDDGNLSPFFEQDRSRWDPQLISEGQRLLELGGDGSSRHPSIDVEAADAAVHCSARHAADTDWAAIVSLYDSLMAIRSSPVRAARTELRRRCAASGAEAGAGGDCSDCRPGAFDGVSILFRCVGRGSNFAAWQHEVAKGNIFGEPWRSRAESDGAEISLSGG